MSWYKGDIPENSYYHHEQFNNGYGLSIISHKNSYGFKQGLFEGAVTHGNRMCYATDIGSDVIGYQTFAEVGFLLNEVALLDPNPTCNHRRRDT